MISMDNMLSSKPTSKVNQSNSQTTRLDGGSNKDFRSTFQDSLDRATDKKLMANKDQAKDLSKDAQQAGKNDQNDPLDQLQNQNKADDVTAEKDVKQEPVVEEGMEQQDQQTILALQQLIQSTTQNKEQPIVIPVVQSTQTGQSTQVENSMVQNMTSVQTTMATASQKIATGEEINAIKNSQGNNQAKDATLISQNTNQVETTKNSDAGKQTMANMNQNLDAKGNGAEAQSAQLKGEKHTSAAQQANAQTPATVKSTEAKPQAESLATNAQEGKQSSTTGKEIENMPLAAKTETLDLSKVNIKVAENSNQTTEKPNLPQQVAEKIIYNVKNGRQEFDIQLQPRELGKINVKIVLENGNAQVLLQCSNTKTQQMLLTNSDVLKTIVESNTGMQTTVNVQNEQKQADQYQQQYEREHSKQQEQQRQQQQEQAEARKYSQEDMVSFMNQLKFGLLEQQQVLF